MLQKSKKMCFFFNPINLSGSLMIKKRWFVFQHLSPVIVMVNPSYSFPGSFKLGTLELTVKPSLVLLLNCFRKYKQTETEGATWGCHCFTVIRCETSQKRFYYKNECQAWQWTQLSRQKVLLIKSTQYFKKIKIVMESYWYLKNSYLTSAFRPYLHNWKQIFYFIHIFKSLTNLQQSSGVVCSAKGSNNHELLEILGLGNEHWYICGTDPAEYQKNSYSLGAKNSIEWTLESWEPIMAYECQDLTKTASCQIYLSVVPLC